MSQALRWGILGTGMIARKFAAAVAESETGTLAAAASRSEDRARSFLDEHGAGGERAHGSYEGLLADDGVDAVYIALPNHMHCAWAIRAAERGKAILLEKPMATNHPEAMLIVDAARRHGVFLMEAFMYRCHPQTAKIAELIRNGAIGELRTIETRFGVNQGTPNLDNIRFQNEAAGGGIMDLGCYCVSLARLAAGAALGGEEPADPVSVRGAAHIGPESRVDEWASAVLAFPGNVIATATCGHLVPAGTAARFLGSEGEITVGNPWFPKQGENAITLHRRGEKEAETVTVHGPASLYCIEADTVAAHVGSPEAPFPSMTWADSLGNQKAVDQWRWDAGLVFDRERDGAAELKAPLAGRALMRAPERPMPAGAIRGIDKPVSRMVMGTMSMHDRWMPFACAMLDHFYEQGGTAIDTAHLYAGGGAERAVGRWLRWRGLEDEMVVIGKGAASTDLTPEMIDRQLHESLERFGTGHIDLYLLHRDNPDLPVGEIVDCLHEHREAGRISAYGGSNWTPERIAAANDYAEKNGRMPFSASSPNFALAVWNEPMWGGCVRANDPDSIAWHRETRMPLLAWSSQANGLFTGRFAPEDRERLGPDHDIVRTWFNDENFRRLERARELAAEKGVSATHIALAYVLNQPLEIYALFGPRTIGESSDSLRALDVTLSDDELAWLNLER